MNDIWKNMRTSYGKMGLSEDEINKRILCKCDIVLQSKNKTMAEQLCECDKKHD